MARYNPVFVPWIATIRSPTGIKLNCAKLENKVWDRERECQKDITESQRNNRGFWIQTGILCRNTFCVSTLCHISHKPEGCDLSEFMFMETIHYVTFIGIFTASKPGTTTKIAATKNTANRNPWHLHWLYLNAYLFQKYRISEIKKYFLLTNLWFSIFLIKPFLWFRLSF